MYLLGLVLIEISLKLLFKTEPLNVMQKVQINIINEGWILDKVVKNCMKITKSTFLGQTKEDMGG